MYVCMYVGLVWAKGSSQGHTPIQTLIFFQQYQYMIKRKVCENK